MNSKKNLVKAGLTVLGVAAAMGQSTSVAAANPPTRTAVLKLQYIFAVEQNGSPDPSHDGDCKKQLSQVQSKYLGLTVRTKFSINPTTLMMSATSTLPLPVAVRPEMVSVELNPLGLAGSYAFGAFRPPALPGAQAVLFSVNLKYANAKSTLLIKGTQGTYNCLISSTATPFQAAYAAKFGTQTE